jgi:hypothetical protein
MPDGQRFLALAPAADAEAPSMTVILDWAAELSAACERQRSQALSMWPHVAIIHW